MAYHFSKIIKGNWDEVKTQVIEALGKEGFGVLTQADIKATLHKKLGVDFRPYEILGACHPGFAHQALQAEQHIGTMLPCNVIMQEVENGEVEVSAVDPVASMQAIENEKLGEVAMEVRNKLKNIIESI